jgi:hypothetical protein
LVRFEKSLAKQLSVYKSLAAFSLGAIIFFLHPIRQDETRTSGLAPRKDLGTELGAKHLNDADYERAGYL